MRCNYIWFRDNGTGWVQCLNNAGSGHGPRHEHALAWVAVENEDDPDIKHYWIT